MAVFPQVSVVKDLRNLTYGDGLVAAWGPDYAFLVTSPNVTFLPEIVQGVVTVQLRDDGAFGKHDPMQWPQLYVPQYPYLAAIPKSPTAEPNAGTATDSAIWNHSSRSDFLELPNTLARGFGHLCPQFLHSLEPVIAQMSSKCRQYRPPHFAIDVKPLREYECEMSQTWQRLHGTVSTFRDQMIQMCALRRYWLLCSSFMTFHDLLYRPPSPEPLPVNLQLMSAWTSEPRVAQLLFSLGIPVWLVRAPHLVSPSIRVAKFIGIGSSDVLCHVKFYGDEPVYHGPAGVHHLEVMFKPPWQLSFMLGKRRDPLGYRDLSSVPTAMISDPNEYRPYQPQANSRVGEAGQPGQPE